MRMKRRPEPWVDEQGSALLAVLGTVAVLAALAFSMTASIRNALDRASLHVDSAQAYFLARGGIEAAVHEMALAVSHGRPPAASRQRRRYAFSTGTADVAIVSEGGKLNVNRASRTALTSLLASAGADEGEAGRLATAIFEYRQGLLQGRIRHFQRPGGGPGNRIPLSSFERHPASIQVIEELLSIPGITPDLVYGSYRRAAASEGNTRGLRRVDGLLQFLRTDGPASLDVNAASFQVLQAAGLPASLARRLVQACRTRPLLSGDRLLNEAALEGAQVPLGVGGAVSRWMLTASARLHDGRSARSVSALVGPGASAGTLRIGRWYEQPLSGRTD